MKSKFAINSIYPQKSHLQVTKPLELKSRLPLSPRTPIRPCTTKISTQRGVRKLIYVQDKTNLEVFNDAQFQVTSCYPLVRYENRKLETVKPIVISTILEMQDPQPLF